MSEQKEAAQRSAVKQALFAIKDLKARLEIAERSKHEPIAILGMACRLPGGVDTPEKYWENLVNGVDAIADIPKDRFDVDRFFGKRGEPGKMYVRQGGFLDRIDGFDQRFFNISPREVISMDPQQRLLLEVMWEALENAGILPEALKETQTGVFVGMMFQDYLQYQIKFGKQEDIDIYTGTGNVASVAGGRLSYVLGLMGSNISLDTACSSSLVTFDLAVQNLRSGKSDLALAGGVNVLLSPEMYISLAAGGTLADDARCKTFDSRANGYVRSEGCGMVVLKRLSDAQRDGDPILAVIRGTAVNHDGPASGLTVPNGVAQKKLIQQALKDGQVEPAAVDYVECHGTGTPQGDPIEVNAIKGALGTGRDATHPITLGSAKTFIGHLETAAGVAGLIKVVLSLQNEKIPANLHFKELNPAINFDDVPGRIASEPIEWKRSERPRIGAVSSFGLSGTNAHVILEEAPVQERLPVPEESEDRLYLLPVTARSASALRELAGRFRDSLNDAATLAGAALYDICHSAVYRRQQLQHRMTTVFRTRAELIDNLDAFARGEERPGMFAGEAVPGGDTKLAAVASGQGPKFWPLDRELLDDPAFGETIRRCDAVLQEIAGWSLLEKLQAPEESSDLDRTEFTQPALTSIQISLFEMWKARGVEPEAVVGHSMGEVPAAYMAGALSLEDALLVIYHRGRLIQTLTGGRGKMAFVDLPRSEVEEFLKGREDLVSVAAINSPGNTVISGDAQTLLEIVATMESKEVFVKVLESVDFASHSPQMAEIQDELRAAIGKIQPRAARVPFYSTVKGDIVPGEDLGPAYWAENIRQPVLFSTSIEKLLGSGHNIFLEIAPHPALSGSVKQCIAAGKQQAWAIASLNRKEAKMPVFLGALGALYDLGYPLDWSQFFPVPGNFVRLPNYPWQRERYWIATTEGNQFSTGGTLASINLDDLWSGMVQEGRWQTDMMPVRLSRSDWWDARDALRNITNGYIIKALVQVGALDGHRKISEESVLKLLAPIMEGRRQRSNLVTRWIDRLRRFRYLIKEGKSYSYSGDLEHLLKPKELNQFITDNLRILNEHLPNARDFLLPYIQESGEQLGDILLGDSTPLQVLFSDSERPHALYNVWGVSFYLNGLLRASLRGLLAHLQGQSIRILEVGAGTGGLTQELLPIFDSGKTEFVYSDISDAFFAQTQERFREYSFVEYRTLDITADFESQGFSAGEFDVIIASNVLHAVRNSWKALENVYQLLAPGGFFLVCEITRKFHWFEITSALLDAWEDFDEDPLRKKNKTPLLKKEEWIDALRNIGFDSDVAVFPVIENNPDDIRNHLGQHVILTRRPVGPEDRQIAFGSSRPIRENKFKAPSPGQIYELDWAERSLTGEKRDPGAILAFMDRDGRSRPIIQSLTANGHRVIEVSFAENFGLIESDRFQVHPHHLADFERLWEEISSANIGTILVLSNLDAPVTEIFDLSGLEAFLSDVFGMALNLLKILQRSATKPRIHFVSICAFEIGDRDISVNQSPLIGFARTVSAEHPDLWGGVIDLDLDLAAQAELVSKEICIDDKEDQIAYRDGRRYVARLRASRREFQISSDFSGEGSFLITGAFGNLGIPLSKWMADHGAKRIIMLGRTPLPPREEWDGVHPSHLTQRIKAVLELESRGVEVHVAAVDASDTNGLRTLIEGLDSSWLPIRGIQHLAVTVDPIPLVDHSLDVIMKSLRVKISSAYNLHQLLKDGSLDFIYYYSSAAALFPPLSGHMGGYAAGNNFLDTFARHLQRNGFPATSINWGIWAGSMDESVIKSFEVSGVGNFTMEEGFEFLAKLPGVRVPQIALLPHDWGQIGDNFPDIERVSLLKDLINEARIVPDQDETNSKESANEGIGLDDFAGVSPDERFDLMERYLAERIGSVMRIPPADVHSQTSLKDQGADSIMAVELRNRIQKELDVQLPVSRILDGSNIVELSKLLLKKLPIVPGKQQQKKKKHAAVNATIDDIANAVPEERVELMERYLSEKIGTVMRISPEKIARSNSIKDQGADSIMAVELRNQIQKELQIQLPVSRILDGSSIRDLSKLLLKKIPIVPGKGGNNDAISQPEDEATPDSIDVAPAPIRGQSFGQVELSNIQRGLWFLKKLTPKSSAYNINYATQVISQIDEDAFSQAASDLIDRHSILRTSFIDREGRPVGIIHKEMEADVEFFQAGNWSEKEMREARRREVEYPFNLEEESLIRFRVFSQSSNAHIVLLNSHALILDENALEYLWNEFQYFYEARRLNNPVEPPEIKSTYEDFVSWERDFATSPEREKQNEFWDKILRTEMDALDPSGEGFRPPMRTYGGNIFKGRVPENLVSSEIRTPEERLEAFSFLLASFLVLIYRSTEHRDILIGFPSSLRTISQFSGAIGNFINPLPLRFRLDPELTFDKLKVKVRQTVTEALENRAVPFPDLVERIRPLRYPARSPIFQILFDYDIEEIRPEQLIGSLSATRIDWETSESPYELIIRISEDSQGFGVKIKYKTDMYSDGAVEHSFNRYIRLMNSVQSDPGQELYKIKYIPEQEENKISEWNQTDQRLSIQFAHHPLEQLSRAIPGAIAAQNLDRWLTYDELNTRANQLAHYLREKGVRAGVSVCLCSTRTPDILIGLFGILKAGGACVPLDPVLSAPRLFSIIKDSGTKILITRDIFRGRFEREELGENLEIVVQDNLNLDEYPIESPEIDLSPRDTALITYTFHDEVLPTGILLSHEALSNTIAWQIEESMMSIGARTLQINSVNSAVFMQEVFSTLGSGGTLLFASRKALLNDLTFADWLTENSVDRIFVPRSTLEGLAEIATSQGVFPSYLRELNVVGERVYISQNIVNFLESIPGCRLHYHFGFLECPIATNYTLDDLTVGWPDHLPIGTPVGNTKLHLLNSRGEPVALGLEGELFIESKGLAEGYLGRPEQTERFFKTWPDGTRVFSTGYYARMRGDGNVTLTGPVKSKVVVRGANINLREIETALEQHPTIRQAYVMKHEDVGDNGLLAYIVSDQIVDRMVMLIKCQAEYNGKKVLLVTQDVSPSGLSLQGVPADWHEGLNVKLTLILPGGQDETIALEGVVMWVNSDRAGIRYNEIKAPDRALLKITLTRIIEMEQMRTTGLGQSEFRVPLRRHVRVLLGDGSWEDLTTEELSNTGISVLSVPRHWEQDKKVTLSFKLPGVFEEMRLKSILSWREGARTGFSFQADDEEREKLDKFFMHYARNQLLTISQLRSYLKERLPYYFIPTIFVIIDALPQLPDGRVNTRQLKFPVSKWYSTNKEITEPRTPVEGMMAMIWENLLGKKVDISSNFFDVGGHSLLAVEVLALIEETFRVELPLQSLWAAPTIRDLSELVVRTTAELEEQEEILEILEDLSRDELKSFLQQQLMEEET